MTKIDAQFRGTRGKMITPGGLNTKIGRHSADGVKGGEQAWSDEETANRPEQGCSDEEPTNRPEQACSDGEPTNRPEQPRKGGGPTYRPAEPRQAVEPQSRPAAQQEGYMVQCCVTAPSAFLTRPCP